MAGMSTPSDASAPPVLVLCADDGIAGELILELASRRYQPLLGPWGWSWRATLEWARPVAAVVDRNHPAARSEGFVAVSNDLEVGLVVFGDHVDVAPWTASTGADAVAVLSPVDVRLIGGAVDAAVLRRSA